MRTLLAVAFAGLVVLADEGPAWALGPSYDCSKATAPLAQAICASPDLSRLDLEFVQAYYAFRQQVGAAGQAALLREAAEFQAMVLRVCQVPVTGPAPATSPALSDCIASEYQGQRDAWLTRLSGPARQEATRPIEQQMALQRDLQALGYLPPTATIDGVYGAGTRAAIAAWQQAQHEPATGLLSDADAMLLQRMASSGAADQVSVLDDTFKGSYGKPTNPDPSDLTLSNFAMGISGPDFDNDLNVSFVVRLSNSSEARWKASACIRYYDKEGLEIDNHDGSDVNIGPDQSDTSNGHSYIKPELWVQVETIKVYAARYGCIESPGEAISPVLTLNRHRPASAPPPAQATAAEIQPPSNQIGAQTSRAPAAPEAHTPNFVMPPDADTLPISGPRALCRQPGIIRNIIKALSEVSAIKEAHESVYDFEDSTTAQADPQSLTFSCHGVARISNGQTLPGTFIVSKNSAGEPVWWWINDTQSVTGPALQRASPQDRNLKSSRGNGSVHHADISAIKDLPVVELADLIVDVLPAEGFNNLGWDYMVNDPIISWQTNGAESTEAGMVMRVGLARVRVAGVSAEVLRRTWRELPWSVTLSTTGNEKFGPKSIEIEPGGPDPADICFGSMSRGCAFTPAEALASSKLSHELVCTSSEPGGVITAYSVSALGKQPSLLVYHRAEGSGGTSNWIEIRPLSDRPEVCGLRVWLGVELQQDTPEIAENLGLGKAAGAVVSSLSVDSPASKAGIRAGDIILRFDNKDATDTAALVRIIAAAPVGKQLPIVVWRNGTELTLQATLEARPDTTQPTMIADLGLAIAPIRPDLQTEFQLSGWQRGLLIVGVMPGTAAAERGLTPGDIIIAIQDSEIASIGEFMARIDLLRKQHRPSVLLLVQRKQQRVWVPLLLSSSDNNTRH